MVVKNVTGYDMSKLYVGSLGTLAAIVRANFKTLPLPELRRAAIAALPERTRERALAHVLGLESEPAVAAHPPAPPRAEPCSPQETELGLRDLQHQRINVVNV